MGWLAAASEVAPEDGSDTSVTVALIALLGTVLVALIGLGTAWISRAGRTAVGPPPTDPKLGERIAVIDTIAQEDRRTLAELDRHVDGIGTIVERLRWDIDDLKEQYKSHNRQHHGDLS